jgi:hypothetical protein
MKRANVTHYFIIGIVIIIAVSFSFYTFARNNQSNYENELEKGILFTNLRVDFKDYVHTCIIDSATSTLDDTGLREETLQEYEELASKKIKECVKTILDILIEQDYTIDEGSISTNAQLFEETVDIKVTYPITLIKDSQKIEFKEFKYTLDKSNYILVPGGITQKEIILTSKNGKSSLTFPKGTLIKNKNGQPVESISIKLKDISFNNIQDKYVIGQIVYDNSPDGAYFSKPVKLSIEFREEDIPEGFTKENIRLGYWNNDMSLWYATTTEIIENRAVADIFHFSVWSGVVGKSSSVWNGKGKTDSSNNKLERSYELPENDDEKNLETIFFQRYASTGISANKQGNKKYVWKIYGGSQNREGTAILDTTIHKGLTYNQLPDCRRDFYDNKNYFVKPINDVLPRTKVRGFLLRTS